MVTARYRSEIHPSFSNRFSVRFATSRAAFAMSPGSSWVIQRPSIANLDSLILAETIKKGTTLQTAAERDGRLDDHPLRDGTGPFAEFLRQATIRNGSGPSLGARGITPSGHFLARQSSSCGAKSLKAGIGANTDYSAVQN